MIEEGGPCPNGDVVERILDVDNKAAGLTDGITDPIDVGNDVSGGGDFGDLARCHEAILEIDYNMGSPLTNYAVEHTQTAPPLSYAAYDVRIDFGFVHERGS
jgi:hypothetical protein